MLLILCLQAQLRELFKDFVCPADPYLQHIADLQAQSFTCWIRDGLLQSGLELFLKAQTDLLKKFICVSRILYCKFQSSLKMSLEPCLNGFRGNLAIFQHILEFRHAPFGVIQCKIEAGLIASGKLVIGIFTEDLHRI